MSYFGICFVDVVRVLSVFFILSEKLVAAYLFIAASNALEKEE